MKHRFICLLTAAGLLLTGCASGESGEEKKDDTTNTSSGESISLSNAEAPRIQGYERVWYDEFEKGTLDDSIWSYKVTGEDEEQSDLQTYTDSNANVYLRNGCLVLKAKKAQTDGDTSYTSGRIIADQPGRDFTFGKIAVRAKVPGGKGLHTAVKLLPVDESTYGEWPKSGEIDLMETIGTKMQNCYGTIAFGTPHTTRQGSYDIPKGSFDSDFHEFTVEWNPGEIVWAVDGNPYYKTTDWFTHNPGTEDPAFPAPFDKPFQIQLELAVGGTWAGDPNDSTDFNKAEFVIDYVRVYQKHEYDTNVERSSGVYRNPDDTGNYIVNGSFADNEKLDDDWYWTFKLFTSGRGSAEIADDTLTVTTLNQGSLDYSVQLVQAGLPAKKDKRYRFSFDAWADEDRTMIVDVSAPDHNFGRYMPDEKVELTTEKQHYSFEFDQQKNDDPNARIEFNMGSAGSTANIYIQNVRYELVE